MTAKTTAAAGTHPPVPFPGVFAPGTTLNTPGGLGRRVVPVGTPKNPFTFYCTFHPVLAGAFPADPPPVTIGYDVSGKARAEYLAYPGASFVHAGNWWNIPKSRWTREAVLEGQQALAREAGGPVAGLMARNVPPGFPGVGDAPGSEGSPPDGDQMCYWVARDADRGTSLATNLADATWAREQAPADPPVYCSLQVSTAKEASRWFARAKAAGHSHFAIGVSEFLRSPKYRHAGIRRLVAICLAARAVLGPAPPLHLSGMASAYLLPVFASLGVSSTDGSTPVQSALAYGTVFLPTGKGVRASALTADQLAKAGTNAGLKACPACAGRSSHARVEHLHADNAARVVHNVHIWRALVAEIQSHVPAISEHSAWRAYFAARVKNSGSRYLQTVVRATRETWEGRDTWEA